MIRPFLISSDIWITSWLIEKTTNEKPLNRLIRNELLMALVKSVVYETVSPAATNTFDNGLFLFSFVIFCLAATQLHGYPLRGTRAKGLALLHQGAAVTERVPSLSSDEVRPNMKYCARGSGFKYSVGGSDIRWQNKRRDSLCYIAAPLP